MTTIATQHPYLSGGYAPTADEVEVDELETFGQLPAALTGRYLRTGPNPIDVPDGAYHWFTGAGMVHGIRIAIDGSARMPWPTGWASRAGTGRRNLGTTRATPTSWRSAVRSCPSPRAAIRTC